MSGPTLFALGGYAAVVATAYSRNRTFGTFALIVLAFPVFAGLALADSLGPIGQAMPVLQAITFVHFLLIVLYPRMRPWPVRIAVTYPALWMVTSTFLAFPWWIASAWLDVVPGAFVPFALGLIGVLQSLFARETEVDVTVDDGAHVDTQRRWPEMLRASVSDEPPLRIIQITDPHLGPFMSERRLRRICERTVERNPDLVFVTGDLMTMESHDPELLLRALAPLEKMRGRVYACWGNHDQEAPAIVRRAYDRLGIILLEDESVIVDTPAGPWEIVGFDHVWQGRAGWLLEACAKLPRTPGIPRIALLHDPGSFRHLPPGQADLVLSGHTHGGQLGLVSLGLPLTFISLVSKVPDHGPWARGRDRLYVHRAHGVYGFPVRLGVPAEQSLLRVHRPATA